MHRLALVRAVAPVLPGAAVAVPVVVPVVAEPPAAALAVLRLAVVVAAAVVVAVRVPRAPSGVPVVRPSVAASPRSSAVKSLIRWKRPRLVACASVKVTVRSCGCAADRR